MIVSLYMSLLAIMFIALSVHVIRGRWKFKVSLADGDNKKMQRRIRAHGNFIEYTLFFLIMLSFAEENGLPPYATHLFGISFLIGRLSHAYGLLRSKRKYRIAGMVCTLTVMGLISLLLFVQYILSV